MLLPSFAILEVSVQSVRVKDVASLKIAPPLEVVVFLLKLQLKNEAFEEDV